MNSYDYQKIEFTMNDSDLKAEDFLELKQQVWPGNYDPELTQLALKQTINITARHEQMLVGCVRILSDGYYFGTIPEILVLPQFQNMGIGTRLLEMAWDISPTSLFLGAQPGEEELLEKLGYTKTLHSFVKIKQRSLLN